MMTKQPTVFCDIDGTIFKYRDFNTYTTTNPEVLPGVIECMTEWFNDGVYIVLTTARPEYLRTHTIIELKNSNIPFHQLIMGIGRGSRYLINDSEEPEKPRAFSFALNRNDGFNIKIK
jgi:hypothetical protein